MPVIIFLLSVAIASVNTAFRSDDDWTRSDVRSGDSTAEQIEGPSNAQLLQHLFARSTVHDAARGESAAGPGLRKRNNGAWVWMPAQGYVPLPKNQQTADAGSGGKNGKVMRYGK